MIPESAREIRDVLAARGLSPNRRLGQNFLADANLRDALVRDSGVGDGDLVLEVGPGLGTLTRGLLSTGARVVAVELDGGLFEHLSEEFDGEERLTLIHRDVLEGGAIAPEVLAALATGGGRWFTVSNLPYSAATPFLAAAARHPEPPARIMAMVQREVALRVTARPGQPDYGPLAVLFALFGRARIARDVGGRVFFPPPPVRSAVLVAEPAPGPPGDLAAGERASRMAFLHRRKSLRAALAAEVGSREQVDRVLDTLGIDGALRPEVIPPESYVRIGRALWGDSG